jgi:predicted AAA+ superfamily ATPase
MEKPRCRDFLRPIFLPFAHEDRRGLLRQAAYGAIFDEVQRVHEVFSYLQGVVGADGGMGRFILTGSSRFDLIESILEGLAGRASLLTLLPFFLADLHGTNRASASVDELVYRGLCSTDIRSTD